MKKEEQVELGSENEREIFGLCCLIVAIAHLYYLDF